jgi:DegV family protein with EDD domain
MGLMALVLYAVKLRDSGLPACEIAQCLEKAKDSVKMYAIIDSLKYLRMGGRISSTAAVAGGVLGIKPVITVENGKVQLISKARGFAPAGEKIMEFMRNDGVNTEMPIVFGHSNSADMAQKFTEIVCPAFSIQNYKVDPIGPVVGTNAGPGCVGIAFFSGNV